MWGLLNIAPPPGATAATGSPHTAKSKARRSPPPMSPAENTPSYSSRDTKNLPATAPVENAIAPAASAQAQPQPAQSREELVTCRIPSSTCDRPMIILRNGAGLSSFDFDARGHLTNGFGKGTTFSRAVQSQ